MPDSELASSLGGRQFSAQHDKSLVRYWPLYDVPTYVWEFSSHSDILPFTMLPLSGSALPIPLGLALRD